MQELEERIQSEGTVKAGNVLKVDAFLNRHGVKVKTPTAGFETMSVEDLMRTKETIEDLIAEKELQEQSVTVEGAAVAAEA